MISVRVGSISFSGVRRDPRASVSPELGVLVTRIIGSSFVAAAGGLFVAVNRRFAATCLLSCMRHGGERFAHVTLSQIMLVYTVWSARVWWHRHVCFGLGIDSYGCYC